MQLIDNTWIPLRKAFSLIVLEEILHFIPFVIAIIVAAVQATGLATPTAIYGQRR